MFQLAFGKFQFRKVSREVLAEHSILVKCRQQYWKPGSDTDIGHFQYQLQRLNNPSQTVLLHNSLAYSRIVQPNSPILFILPTKPGFLTELIEEIEPLFFYSCRDDGSLDWHNIINSDQGIDDIKGMFLLTSPDRIPGG